MTGVTRSSEELIIPKHSLIPWHLFSFPIVYPGLHVHLYVPGRFWHMLVNGSHGPCKHSLMSFVGKEKFVISILHHTLHLDVFLSKVKSFPRQWIKG